jgi:hypothetical protein
LKDQTIIQEFERMKKYIEMLENSVRLAFTGQEVRGAALMDLLLTKPALAEKEVHELLSKVISFLGTKVSITEEEAKQLEADLKSVLFKGPILTNEEMTSAIGSTITKMQQQAEAAAKKQATEIIKPTPDQVQQVTNTKPEEPVIPVNTPPQA